MIDIIFDENKEVNEKNILKAFYSWIRILEEQQKAHGNHLIRY